MLTTCFTLQVLCVARTAQGKKALRRRRCGSVPLRLWMCWVATPRLHRMWLGSCLGMPRSRSKLPPAQTLRSPVRPPCHCLKATTRLSPAWRAPLRASCPGLSRSAATPRRTSQKRLLPRRASLEFPGPCQHCSPRIVVPLLGYKRFPPLFLRRSPQMNGSTARSKRCITGHKLIKRKAAPLVKEMRSSRLEERAQDSGLRWAQKRTRPACRNTNQRLQQMPNLMEKSTRVRNLKATPRPHRCNNQESLSKTAPRSCATGRRVRAALELWRRLQSGRTVGRTHGRPRCPRLHPATVTLDKLTYQKHNQISKTPQTTADKRRRQIQWRPDSSPRELDLLLPQTE